MNYWGPHPSSDDKETTQVVVCLRVLHKVIVQKRQRNLEMYKKSVLHVQNYCFAE